MINKQNTAKLLLSGMIASTLVLGTAHAGPMESIAANNSSFQSNTASGNVRMKFPDVSSSHWAMKYITKLALEGIIEGDEKGNYRAESPVSQQDVIIMAIRMMGLEDEAKAKALKSTSVLPFTVDDYARAFVVEAIDKGLITIKEETDAAGISKTSWGSKKAAREWVAKIVIRALGDQDKAGRQAAQPTSFKDNGDISTWALGYINTAVSLNIVNGFEDGSFGPKGEVTRAQMAAFLSRGEKQLTTQSNRVARGYMMNLTDKSITITDSNGASNTYTLSADTVFYGNKYDNPIMPDSIKQTYEVSVIQVQGAAYYVEVINDQQKMDSYEGNLIKVNLNEMKLTLLRNDDYENYELSPDVQVTDQDGRGLSLSALVKGSHIELRRSMVIKNAKISQIVVKEVPVNKSSEGIVQAIQKDVNKITMLETSSGQSETFALSSMLVTQFADNSIADLSMLHVGDTIAYDVVTSAISRIVIKKQVDVGLTVKGTLSLFSPDKTIVIINKAGKPGLGSYYLADKVQVQIDGLTSPGLYDIEVGDDLVLDLMNDKVTKITVTNRSIKNVLFTTIVNYDDQYKLLTVKDELGNSGVYTLSENTNVIYGGNALPFSSFNNFFIRGKKVDLKVSKDKVTTIQLSSQIDGVISQLNLVSNEVTIKTVNGQYLTFKTFAAPQIEIPTKTTSTLTDLKIGDNVTATFSYAQDLVIKFAVNKTFLYKTVLTSSNNQVTVKDDAGVNYIYTLDNTVPLVKPDQSAAAFTDILLDEYLKVSFKGAALAKAEIVTPVRGKVTALDAASGSLTVQEFNNKSQVIVVGANYAVTQADGTVVNLSSVKVSDRVQILKDENDKWIIQIGSASQRVVSSYDNVLNQMVFLPNTTNNKLSYNLYPSAYYHKGTQQLSTASFVSNDVVMIYVLDNKIIEMEKQ